MLSLIYKEQGDMPKARATVERGLLLHPDNMGLAKLLDFLNHSVSEPKAN